MAALLDEDERPLSRAALAAELGISVRHLYRLLAAERSGKAEWAEDRAGIEELPYVELVEHISPPRLHYRLDADQLSRLPECPMRIGRGRGRGLQVAHREDVRGERPAAPKPCPHRFRPKRPKKGKGR